MEKLYLPKCPHCNAAYVEVTIEGSEPAFCSRRRTETEIQVSKTGRMGIVVESWGLWRCNNPECLKLVLAQRRVFVGEEGEEKRSFYPAGSHELSTIPSITAELRNDYREAGKCLDAGCYKASMVMGRRALERCLIEKGCKGKMLYELIENAKSSGVIRPVFHGVADEIRQYGNLSGHPDDKQLDNITKNNAEKVLKFVALLVQDLFVVEAEVEELESNRKNAKS